MLELSPVIRDPTAADEPAWRQLWAGYSAFYEVAIPERVTAHTWQRILDPAAALSARLVVLRDNVAGFSISVLHDSTWTVAPDCYLEDLFVAPEYRGRGLGRLLLGDVMQRAKARGCTRLYWHTRASNPARALYDKFAKADDFVRYRTRLD